MAFDYAIANPDRGDARRLAAFGSAFDDVAERNQSARIGKGQRSQQHTFDNGKYRRRSRDAEGQRNYCGQRERGRFAPLAQRVAQVLKNGIQHGLSASAG